MKKTLVIGMFLIFLLGFASFVSAECQYLIKGNSCTIGYANGVLNYLSNSMQVAVPAGNYTLVYQGSSTKAGGAWPYTLRYDSTFASRTVNAYFTGSPSEPDINNWITIPDSCMARTTDLGYWNKGFSSMEYAEQKYRTCGADGGVMTMKLSVKDQGGGMGKIYSWYQDDTCGDNTGLIWFCANRLAEEVCSSSSDCLTGYVCVGGTCTSTGQCTKNDDCPALKECLITIGVCISPGTTCVPGVNPTGCLSGDICSPSGNCVVVPEEICDGIDNDGNGVIDEGFDLDGDNYTICGSGDGTKYNSVSSNLNDWLQNPYHDCRDLDLSGGHENICLTTPVDCNNPDYYRCAKCVNPGVSGSCSALLIENITLTTDKEYLSHLGADSKEYNKKVLIKSEGKEYYVTTEYDDLRCEVSGGELNSAKLKVNNAVEEATCENGKCYAVFKNEIDGPWERGTKIKCDVAELNGEMLIQNYESEEVIIAKYDYYFVMVNQENWGNAKEQYVNYINLSKLNANFDVAGKPVYFNQKENIDIDSIFSKSLGDIDWNKGSCNDGDCRSDVTRDDKKLVCTNGYGTSTDRDLCCWEGQKVVIMPDGTRECYNSNEANKIWYEQVDKIPKGILNWNEGNCDDDNSKCREDMIYTGEGVFSGNKLVCKNDPYSGLFSGEMDRCCWQGQIIKKVDGEAECFGDTSAMDNTNEEQKAWIANPASTPDVPFGKLDWNTGVCKEGDCRQDISYDGKKLVCMNDGYITATNKNICCWEGQKVVIMPDGTRECYNSNEADKIWYKNVKQFVPSYLKREELFDKVSQDLNIRLEDKDRIIVISYDIMNENARAMQSAISYFSKRLEHLGEQAAYFPAPLIIFMVDGANGALNGTLLTGQEAADKISAGVGWVLSVPGKIASGVLWAGNKASFGAVGYLENIVIEIPVEKFKEFWESTSNVPMGNEISWPGEKGIILRGKVISFSGESDLALSKSMGRSYGGLCDERTLSLYTTDFEAYQDCPNKPFPICCKDGITEKWVTSIKALVEADPNIPVVDRMALRKILPDPERLKVEFNLPWEDIKSCGAEDNCPGKPQLWTEQNQNLNPPYDIMGNLEGTPYQPLDVNGFYYDGKVCTAPLT